MIELNDFIKKYKPVVESQLIEYLSFKLNDPRSELKKAMCYSISAKAKRIRPIIVLSTFSLFNNKFERILPLACAIEMIHTYSLIHDDLPAMDNDDFRRGQPTCHKKFREDIAILAGDTLNTFAFELIAKEMVKYYPAQKVLKSIELLSSSCGIFGMAGGQVLDLLSNSDTGSYDQLKSIHKFKTGALIKACITIPAVLENADTKTYDSLSRFADNLGLLFQIIDDILDVTGKKEVLGKSPNKDIKQNKLTYIKLFGLEKAKDAANKEMIKAQKNLDNIKNIDTGILQQIILYFVNREF
ncbi:MAG: polyprenyl synthetase family protein [bacterium]|nr:polyprenyl synthetase family protein [bacterium]